MKMKRNNVIEDFYEDYPQGSKPLIPLKNKIAIIGVVFIGILILIILSKIISHEFRGFFEEFLNPTRLWENVWMPIYAILALTHLFFAIPFIIRFNDAALAMDSANYDMTIIAEIFCVIGIVLSIAFGFIFKLAAGLIVNLNINPITAGIAAAIAVFLISGTIGAKNFLLSYGLLFGFWCASFFHYAAGFGICAFSAGAKISVWYMLSLAGSTLAVLSVSFLAFAFLNVTKPSNH